MHTFNKRETQNWNEILKSASLQLTKGVVDHCDNILASLRPEERRARRNIVLSALEASELEFFEKKKTEEIVKTKIKKLSRDKVSYSNEFSQSNSAIYQANISKPKNTPEIRSCRSKELPRNQKNIDGNIINLYSVQLNIHERSVISRRLTFCPSIGG